VVDEWEKNVRMYKNTGGGWRWLLTKTKMNQEGEH
jgi:hypothetical protein